MSVPSHPIPSIDSDACHFPYRVFGVSTEDSVSLANFLKSTGQLKLRGTSKLLRLPQSPVIKRMHMKPKSLEIREGGEEIRKKNDYE